MTNVLKIMVIGSSGIGKTSLMNRFCDGEFSYTVPTTIGIDFKVKTVELGDKRKFRLQVSDTAGQDRLKAVATAYYRGAHGILLTYAVNDQRSFEDLVSWLKEVGMHGKEDVRLVVVGTKKDMDNRVISYETAKKFADSISCEFFETSAKNNEQVTEAFMEITRQAVDHFIDKAGPAVAIPAHAEQVVHSIVKLVSTHNVSTEGNASAAKSPCCA